MSVLGSVARKSIQGITLRKKYSNLIGKLTMLFTVSCIPTLSPMDVLDFRSSLFKCSLLLSFVYTKNDMFALYMGLFYPLNENLFTSKQPADHISCAYSVGQCV